MNKIICPNCGSGNLKEHLSLKDYFLTQDHFTIYECANCKVLFTYPFPEADILYSKYYKSENYLSHNKKASDLFSKLYRTIQKINIRKKLRLLESINRSSEKKILEVGAGIGDFLAACRNNGWNCFGVEPSEQARQVAKQFNNLDLAESIDAIGEKDFSVITLWHVLEHVPDLDATIQKLKTYLYHNGRLIIAVPNHNSFDAKHYKQFWAGYDVPRHLYHFNKKSLTSIMQSKGFELIRTKPMVFDSFYVSLLSETYKHNNLITNYLKGFYNGLASNIASVFTKESSSIIFIFQKRGEVKQQ
jgi:2-polyprenyl-3-methyl-5-hydroxy-6-metoxy-1,4-benzoquinol methylase